LRELQSPTQYVQFNELAGAVGAMLEMALTFGRASRTELTVEIALKEGIGKITPHEQPPCKRSLATPNITVGGHGKVRT
jgi:hypothetical protein